MKPEPKPHPDVLVSDQPRRYMMREALKAEIDKLREAGLIVDEEKPDETA